MCLSCRQQRANPDFLVQYLAPLEFRAKGIAKYEFTKSTQNKLGTENLAEFDVICLLDPAPLAAATWKRIERFVRRGGGLAIFLGREANAKFSSEAAMGLLPAAINRQWRDDEGLILGSQISKSWSLEAISNRRYYFRPLELVCPFFGIGELGSCETTRMLS